MGDLRYNPEYEGTSQISAGTIADFVSGLTADPSAPASPSLSEFFTEKGVDAGLSFHSGPQVYVEANPWTFNDRQTPEDGMNGTIIERNGHLSFGLESNLGDEHTAYVDGEYSVRFGHGGWTPPETESFEYPVYDDDGNEIGVETDITEYPGFHEYDGPVTTLSVIGHANTAGDYHFAGVAEHERTINVGGRDFDFDALGAIGVDNDYGTFATAYGEVSTLVHAESGTSLYAGAGAMFAQNDEYSNQYVEGGVETSALNRIPGIGEAIPPVRAGLQYDGQDIKPTVGIGFEF